ncbi:hypothetical protein [Pedobacter nutrimenti]|uniref:hypothetical protein n=1 Tax=Pedobacter nutrimenti TaxID=1241337 RepID=UPI00292F5198|nr:hypothetical protein [Pedobacter nutrimenti]
MKKLLLIILPLTLIMQAKAQNASQRTSISLGPIYNIGPSDCPTCQCQFDNLFRNWTAENIVNCKEIYPINYSLVDTLTEANIKSYFDKIMDPDRAYFCKYSGNTKILSLLTLAGLRKQMQSEGATAGKIDSLSLKTKLTFKKYMELGLKPGNKVYLIKVKYGDKIIDNYAFCDTTAGKIMWDNLFYFLWIPPPNKDAFNKN